MTDAHSGSVFQRPHRSNPVAGAFVGTIVLAAVLAPPALILALIVWLWARAARRGSVSREPDRDAEFSSRFHALEKDILDE